MTVSLVGYTNAGKSTLMNALTDADVLAADKLFATLDTRTRRWHLPKWGPVLLSDTVGFIRDLPHSLIASFKATLEETRQADLLLHVADASNPKVMDQIKSVYGVLQEIGVEAKDTLLVLNKVDHVQSISQLDAVLGRYPNAVPVSAKTRLGFERLHTVVSDALSRSFQDVDIEMSVANGKLLAYLAAKGEILSTQYGEDMVKVHCRLPQKHLGKIDPSETIITPHTPSGWISESAHDEPPAVSDIDTPAASVVLETDEAVSTAEEAAELSNNRRSNLEFESRESTLPSTQSIPVDSSLSVDDATT
jgi:GTP-binding protein HflX